MGKGKLKNAIKHIVDKAKGAVKKVGGDVAFSPLLPFLPMMKKELDRLGVKHTNDLGEVSKSFVDNVIKKIHGQHFEYVDGQNLYAEAASAIISTIIAFFQNIKDKKAKGEALSADEQRVLNTAESTINTVTDAAADSAQSALSSQVKDFIFSWKGGATLIGLIILFAWMGHRRS